MDYWVEVGWLLHHLSAVELLLKHGSCFSVYYCKKIDKSGKVQQKVSLIIDDEGNDVHAKWEILLGT